MFKHRVSVCSASKCFQHSFFFPSLSLHIQLVFLPEMLKNLKLGHIKSHESDGKRFIICNFVHVSLSLAFSQISSTPFHLFVHFCLYYVFACSFINVTCTCDSPGKRHGCYLLCIGCCLDLEAPVTPTENSLFLILKRHVGNNITIMN